MVKRIAIKKQYWLILHSFLLVHLNVLVTTLIVMVIIVDICIVWPTLCHYCSVTHYIHHPVQIVCNVNYTRIINHSLVVHPKHSNSSILENQMKCPRWWWSSLKKEEGPRNTQLKVRDYANLSNVGVNERRFTLIIPCKLMFEPKSSLIYISMGQVLLSFYWRWSLGVTKDEMGQFGPNLLVCWACL